MDGGNYDLLCLCGDTKGVRQPGSAAGIGDVQRDWKAGASPFCRASLAGGEETSPAASVT